jgi:hypothetical protein
MPSSEPPVSVQVVVRGAPTQLKLETVETRIPADRRSTATVKLLLMVRVVTISFSDFSRYVEKLT